MQTWILKTGLTYNCQDSWKAIPYTAQHLLLGVQASPKEKPLVLYSPIYQPRKTSKPNDKNQKLIIFKA